MGQPQAQLNPHVDDTEVILRILNATPTGSVDTSILRFDASFPSGTGIVVSTSPTTGTILTIHRAGLYLVTFQCSQAASNTIQVGISVNTTNLTGDPVGGAAGVLAAQAQTTPAATVLPVGLSHPVPISGAEANNTTGIGNAQAQLRLHATNGGGAAITAGNIVANTAQVTIRRLTGLAA